MKWRLGNWGPILGLAGGAALGALLLQHFDLEAILRLTQRGVAGLALLVPLHAVQIVATAIAWWTLSRCLGPAPSLGTFARLRWLREGINGLLPVAQIGGPVLAVRLLGRSGQSTAAATAGIVVDTSVEMLTQIAFTLCGLAILVALQGADTLGPGAFAGIIFLALTASALLAVQRLGGARLIERIAARLGWESAADGLHDGIMAIYRNRRAFGTAAFWHMTAWLLGGVEVAIAFHYFGHDLQPGPALVIESLGQAARSAGFAIPAAVGVQEGSYVLVCGLLGLSPELALALSLIKRLREVVFGVPTIALWQWLERPKKS